MTEWLVPKRHRFFCEKHPLNIKCKMQNAKCKVQTPRLHTKDCPTVASLVYGVPLNERSRVLGVRVEGGGEPASRRESFKSKVTFLTISPPPANAGAPSSEGAEVYTHRTTTATRKWSPNSSLPCVKGGVKIFKF